MTAQSPPFPQRHFAYFSPLPPARSGIADYSRALLPHLAQTAQITLFTEKPDSVKDELKASFNIQPISEYPNQRWNFDLTLYQMGNSSHHEAIYETAVRYPGLVILHDHGLHHFMAHRTVDSHDYSGYIREMGYALGLNGIQLAWDIREQRADHPLFAVPLNNRLVDRSLGLIVHSQVVADMLAEQAFERPIRVIPALMEKRVGQSQRETLNLSSETVIFATLGLVTAEKKLDLALSAFKQLQQTIPDSHFLIVGDVHPEVNLAKIIGRNQLEKAVTQLGFIESLQGFVDWIEAADIIINLRHPTVGETSATALRAMAAAKPVIVFDLGWYSELPDSAVVKVRPLDNIDLLDAMQRLASQPDLRQQLATTAANYIATHHDPAHIAQQYSTFANQILTNLSRQLEVLHD